MLVVCNAVKPTFSSLQQMEETLKDLETKTVSKDGLYEIDFKIFKIFL